MASTEIIHTDHALLFTELSTLLFENISQCSGEYVVIGLCGGRSIVGLLKTMAEKKDELAPEQWARLQFFMVDERLVGLDDEYSNFKQVNELFLAEAVSSGLLREDQIHPFYFDSSVEDKGLAAYQEEFVAYGGRFDIVFLGVGEDAHVAALFPNGVWTKEESQYFLSFDDSPKPPSGRMSSSPNLVRQASLVVALFIGEGKKDALLRYRDSSLSLEDCPVKLIDQVQHSVLASDLML